MTFLEKLNALKAQQAQALEKQNEEARIASERAALTGKHEAISEEIVKAEAAAAEATSAISEANAFSKEQGAALDPEVAQQIEQLRQEAGETIARLGQLRAEADALLLQLAELSSTQPAEVPVQGEAATPAEVGEEVAAQPEDPNQGVAEGGIEDGGGEQEVSAETSPVEIPEDVALEIEKAREQWENAEKRAAMYAGYLSQNEAALSRLSSLKDSVVEFVTLPRMTLGEPGPKILQLVEETKRLREINRIAGYKYGAVESSKREGFPKRIAEAEAELQAVKQEWQAFSDEIHARGAGLYRAGPENAGYRIENVIIGGDKAGHFPKSFHDSHKRCTLQEAYDESNEMLRGLIADYTAQAAAAASLVANIEQTFPSQGASS